MSRLLLILEDVAEMREWLRVLVSARHPDWVVQSVGDAISFRRAIDRERPTLALLDEVLGVGEDIASLLQVTRERGIRVALMSGMGPGHRLQVELPPGVEVRLTKPSWSTEAGSEAFLAELGKVMTLTAPGRIG